MKTNYRFADFPDFIVEINLAPYFSMTSCLTDSASGEYSVMERSLRVFRISESMDLSRSKNSGGRDENGTGFGSGRA